MKAFTTSVCALLAITALGTSPAWAHAALTKAEPATGSALETSPSEITLHFNEKLEGAFSTIKVVDANGKNLASPKALLDPADPHVLHVPVPTLKTGRYSVQWVAIGHDGHRRAGDYTFSVK